MHIVEVRERTIPISRYADPAVPSGGLTTSAVAVITDVIRGGRPVIGYGFASIGRFAQGGLIRERFAPRLLAAREADLVVVRERRLPRINAARRQSMLPLNQCRYDSLMAPTDVPPVASLPKPSIMVHSYALSK
jgi:hypothetical protein